jgi:hypothetical protein
MELEVCRSVQSSPVDPCILSRVTNLTTNNLSAAILQQHNILIFAMVPLVSVIL